MVFNDEEGMMREQLDNNSVFLLGDASSSRYLWFSVRKSLF